MALKKLLDTALPVVRSASAFIRKNAGKVRVEQIESKERNSLVSYVDKEAEQILVKGLGKLLPDAGFITEEGTVQQQKSEYTWIIDPLDGTTNFLHQIPFYAVSVALTYKDEIVLGIVDNVEWNETFYAWKGGGAWCNGNRIYVSDRDQITDAMVATGFPYAAEDVLPSLVNTFEFFLKNARGLRRLGSAAIDLAYVACGKFDVYYESSLNAWDIAGGIILVEDAGGKVSDFSGKNRMLTNGEVIAAAGSLHDAVALQIRSFFNA